MFRLIISSREELPQRLLYLDQRSRQRRAHAASAASPPIGHTHPPTRPIRALLVKSWRGVVDPIAHTSHERPVGCAPERKLRIISDHRPSLADRIPEEAARSSPTCQKQYFVAETAITALFQYRLRFNCRYRSPLKQRTRIHLTPQHWHLCHMELY